MFSEHITSLLEVLNVLKVHGLTGKATKTKISKRFLIFLGHLIQEGHISPDDSNVSKSLNIMLPQTKKAGKTTTGCSQLLP